MNLDTSNINHNLFLSKEENFKFISLISHEIKNSFNSIIASNNIILRDKLINNPDLNELIVLVQTTAHKSYELLENLIHLFNSPLENYEDQIQTFDVNNAVRGTIDFFRFQIEQKKLSIILNIGSNFRIKTSEKLFSFIFRNLLSNAIKFSDIGGKIEVAYTQNNKLFEFSIKDYGIGLNDSKIEEILSSKDLSNQLVNNNIGTGIGLQLCNHYVKQFGGKMEISSKSGLGSKVIVKLPC